MGTDRGEQIGAGLRWTSSSVSAGSSLYGIVGAFLAVPVVAVGSEGWRYLTERMDARQPAVAPAGPSDDDLR